MGGGNDHPSLREFIERIIKENDRRIEEKFTAADRALKLQAAAYPTTKDFTDLKTHVDEQMGRSKGVVTLFTVASGLSLIISVVIAVLTYLRANPVH